jgi:hypothetical protein
MVAFHGGPIECHACTAPEFTGETRRGVVVVSDRPRLKPEDVAYIDDDGSRDCPLAELDTDSSNAGSPDGVPMGFQEPDWLGEPHQSRYRLGRSRVDRRADTYDNVMDHWQAEQAARLLQPQPAKRILDIDTGTGLAAGVWAKITHPSHVLGDDMRWEMGSFPAAARLMTLPPYDRPTAATGPYVRKMIMKGRNHNEPRNRS